MDTCRDIYFLYLACYLIEGSSKLFSNIYPGLQNLIFGIFATVGISNYIICAYLSSSRKVFYLLMQERRVIFILILLEMLFYVDNFFEMSAAGLIYPFGTLVYVSFDMIVMYFPRKLALGTMVSCVTIFGVSSTTRFLLRIANKIPILGIFGKISAIAP